jgi:signal transduction histidine kinase
VFAAFHQLGEGGVAGRRGVGLGLSVARDLVAMMGGELRLASAPGYGATFTIDLPAA